MMIDASKEFARYVVSRASMGGVLPTCHRAMGYALPAPSLPTDVGWSVGDDVATIWLQQRLGFLISPDTETALRLCQPANRDAKKQARLVLAQAFFEFVLPVKDMRLRDALLNSKTLLLSTMDGAQSVALACPLAPYETDPAIPGAHIMVRL